MKFSIRKRLLYLLLSTLCAAWGIVTWQVYVSTQHEVEELFDANLAQNARVLLGLIQHEIAQHEDEEHEDEEDEEDEEHEEEEEIEFETDLHSGHRYEKKTRLFDTCQGWQHFDSFSQRPLISQIASSFKKL
ncbi:secreted protein [Beggiatoa sp. SS]|nr:secreted protein [Beggiatoa sp. SS]